MAALTITQLRSGIGGKQNHRDTLRSLGLHKIGQSVVREDTPVVLGMVRAVRHLVEVTTDAGTSATGPSTAEAVR